MAMAYANRVDESGCTLCSWHLYRSLYGVLRFVMGCISKPWAAYRWLYTERPQLVQLHILLDDCRQSPGHSHLHTQATISMLLKAFCLLCASPENPTRKKDICYVQTSTEHRTSQIVVYLETHSFFCLKAEAAKTSETCTHSLDR